MDLERVRVFGGRGADAQVVVRRQLDLVRLEARLTIHDDLEQVARLVQLELAEVAAIAVGVVALAKGQLVDVWVRPEVDGAVVQEATHGAAVALVLVNDQHQAVKLGGGVKAVGLVVGMALLDVPQLQVSAAALHASGPEVELGGPVAAVVHGVVRP